MQLHEFTQLEDRKRKRRRGRGGKRGIYSGRGMKGQRSRAGAKIRPALRDLIKKIPKLRGVRFEHRKTFPAVVNVGTLEHRFNSGDVITPKFLVEKRIVRKVKGRVPTVKVLSSGSLTKCFTLRECLFSVAAKEKIEKAGGKVTHS